MQKQRDFFSEAYSKAREAGLNDAQARLAASQAALETGFGKSVVGNNYFGIKAGKSWNGPSVTAGTWEDEGGKAVKQNARFRSYENAADSFRDWAKTVGSKWSTAFNAPTFADAVEGLNYGQSGGYATDRKYGSKLRSINRKYGPQADQVDGIMAAINPQGLPTPQARPDFEQAAQSTGVMSAINPVSVGSVERRQLQPAAGLLTQRAKPVTVNERMGLLNAYSAPQEQPQMVSLDTLRQQQPSMSMAQQYGSYGAGRRPTEMAGLLSQDVARQRMVDALNAQKRQMASGGVLQKTGRLPSQPDQSGLLSQDVAYQGMVNGLNAQKQQLAAGVNPMDATTAFKAGDDPIPQQQAQFEVQPMAYAPIDQQPTASVSQGLLSPSEQLAFNAQRAALSQQPVNRNMGPRMRNFAKGALGGIGGGLLGSLVGGPIGGLLGSLVGKSLMNGKLNTQITGYPQAPDARSQGDGKETDYGRSVRESSRQYDRAVKSGSVGLF